MNKSLATNLIAVLFIAGGYFSPLYKDQILSIGFFALSGAITNWLAVYMLFEKVPGLYGSGVIPNNFEKFKAGIRFMIMEQFFTKANLEKFLHQTESKTAISIEPILDNLDYDLAFQGLVEAVMQSPLGGMLAMFGGAGALDQMKAPFEEKMRAKVSEMAKSEKMQAAIGKAVGDHADTDLIFNKIDTIVHRRLEELTPKMVKDIIGRMIREHLGWLVVWGGVFGGIIGLAMSFI